jgi:putative transposase
MRRIRVTEAQIIGIPKQQQAGRSAGDLRRNNGISDATF